MNKTKLALWGGGAVLACAAAYFYGNRIESKRYRLEHLRVSLGDGLELPNNRKLQTEGTKPVGNESLKKLTILHLSDLHLHGPDKGKAEFLKYITSLDYDLVVLTGDIFEGESGVKYAPALLSKRPRLGAYAILGNHDYYKYTIFNRVIGRMIKRFRNPSKRRDVSSFIAALEENGYKVLRNEFVRLAEEKISLIGVDYPGIDEVALQELAGKAQEEDLLIALFHLPKNLEYFVRANVKLVFGGHTHGGQVRIPGVGALVTDSEMARHEASGLTRRGNTLFHISRGLGQDPFPVTNFRLFCPPAATVLEITYQKSAPMVSVTSDSIN
jgi:predicted MPP superfamily phosphohydrolase